MPSEPSPAPAPRWLAGALGYSLFVVAVLASFGALIALVDGATVPDAYAGYTDFWPGPRTWGEVAVRAGRAVAVAALVGLLYLATTILLRYAFDRPELRLRTALAIPFGLAAAAAVVLGASIAVQLGDARVRPDCGRFRFDAAAWRSPDPDVWRRQALGVGECHGLRRASSAQVLAQLGRPTSTTRRRTVWRYRDGAVVVRFTRATSDGMTTKRVTSTEVNPTRVFDR